MNNLKSYTNKHNASRLSIVKSDAKASTYSDRANASRLSNTASSKPSAYSGRVNVSRLSGVNSEAFVKNATLYSRIGGETEVASVIRHFYGKALVDPRINKFFDFDTAAEMEARIQEQIAFVSAALGGPVHDGMDVRKTREYLGHFGLNAGHFDAVEAGLEAVLRAQNMPHPLIEEMLEFCRSIRAEILG